MNRLINQWTHSWTFYHLLLWGGIIISHAVDLSELAKYDLPKYLSLIVVRNSLLICLTYLNLFVLIPVYSRKNRWVEYWVFLLLAIGVFIFLYNNFLFTYLDIYLRNESEKQVSFQIVANFFTALRYLVLSLLLRFVQDWFEQEKKLHQATVDKLSAELNYLRAQINPHFLFNTLNNLYGLALTKSDLTPKAILKLSDIMEYMLLENTEQKVPLKKEIDNIGNYIELEKLRHSKINSISFVVDGDPASRLIEPFLLFPFFENAFKHGINNNSDNGYLRAYLKLHEKNGFSFTLENSKPLEVSQGHGIGLVNLKKRLSILYPNQYDLRISETSEYFLVSLSINE